MITIAKKINEAITVSMENKFVSYELKTKSHGLKRTQWSHNDFNGNKTQINSKSVMNFLTIVTDWQKTSEESDDFHRS